MFYGCKILTLFAPVTDVYGSPLHTVITLCLYLGQLLRICGKRLATVTVQMPGMRGSEYGLPKAKGQTGGAIIGRIRGPGRKIRKTWRWMGRAMRDGRDLDLMGICGSQGSRGATCMLGLHGLSVPTASCRVIAGRLLLKYPIAFDL